MSTTDSCLITFNTTIYTIRTNISMSICSTILSISNSYLIRTNATTIATIFLMSNSISTSTFMSYRSKEVLMAG